MALNNNNFRIRAVLLPPLRKRTFPQNPCLVRDDQCMQSITYIEGTKAWAIFIYFRHDADTKMVLSTQTSMTDSAAAWEVSRQRDRRPDWSWDEIGGITNAAAVLWHAQVYKYLYWALAPPKTVDSLSIAALGP
ncbi:uncharacterized protein PV09_04418 [Verruconis gallopava]|uniref:Uncharacterized protein n=1 Tax=Verruconis gallopava TaxID=253628 RepID=A0A0D2ACQ0_9PEZI|nr:uncharacterized protein PV09_04418 [Verruconis gallopava]KIW04683.1 hypothetical protein PV09_04418 [Verruconis gallopava]